MKKIYTPPTLFIYFLSKISIKLKFFLSRKNFLFFSFVFLFIGFQSTAQVDMNSQWTWLSGDNIRSQHGTDIFNQPTPIYGTQGIPSQGNKPGTRRNAVSWTAIDGTLWMFGGKVLVETIDGTFGAHFNDLWKYNPATNEWTWMNGDNIPYQSGVYGTKGVSSMDNKPGASLDAISWRTPDGHFWLMDNVLWKYDPLKSEWTWVSGSNLPNRAGVYGTKGIGSENNFPGSRTKAVSWTDKDGNLWLLGGSGMGASSSGNLNDLWKFEPTTNKWTWMSGDNFPNHAGVYGTQGVASSENKPSSRINAISWTGKDGSLWLMGGFFQSDPPGFSQPYGYLNDLWKYNPLTNEWTWMKGSQLPDQEGDFGIQGIPASNNNPSGRDGSTGWTDKDGNLWLKGGARRRIPNSRVAIGDLWKYDPKTNEWTWINGFKSPDYGTLGVPSKDNEPQGRFDAISWTLSDGSFWLYGGGAGEDDNFHFSDLWRLTPTENKYFKDTDADGYGNPDIFKQSNYIPYGYVLKSDDCNDNNASVNPDATELCDGVDNNCNGQIDEDCPPLSLPEVCISDIIVHEGDHGNRNAIFTVWLKGKSTGPVSFQYHTKDGSATDQDDYISKSGTITFDPNCLVKTIVVKIIGDKIKEHRERFILVLTDPVNVVIDDKTATCTIIDDEKEPTIRIHDAKATENSQLVKIKVRLDDESKQVVKVKYDTRDKSAKSPADYTGICNGQLVFLPGETEKYIEVVIKKDFFNEKMEEFELVLKDADNAQIEHGHDGRKIATVKIINSGTYDNGCTIAEGNLANQFDQPLLGLQLKVLPNPSQNYFQLNINSNVKGSIHLRVTDVQGRVVEDRKLEGSNQQIKMGDNWRYGNYFLELTQGGERKIIQLVKLK